MNDLQQMFEDWSKFSVDKFKNANEVASLEKLEEEIEELCEALGQYSTEKIKYEYVDCFMCLLHSMAKYGITIDEFKEAFKTKFAINLNRKWVENENHTYSHKK